MMKIKSTSNISIGTNIKRIVESKGIKKADVIREMQLLGISMTKQKFYKIEHDLINVTADELVILANILDCNISDFFSVNE